MERLKFSVVAFLLVCFTAEGIVLAQLTPERIYLRTSIEKYPPADARPLLKYLDDQRPVADKAMRLVAEGNPDALYALLSSESKKEVSLDQLRALLLRWKEGAGNITSHEYRSQALLAPNDGSSTLELQTVKSQVWYAVQTAKQSDADLFLVVKTSSEGDKNVVSLVQFMDYGDNMPPWLRLPSTKTHK